VNLADKNKIGLLLLQLPHGVFGWSKTLSDRTFKPSYGCRNVDSVAAINCQLVLASRINLFDTCMRSFSLCLQICKVILGS
jgi:hypothetical protein